MRRASLLVSAVLLVGAGFPAAPMDSTPWVGFDDVPPSNIFYADIMWLESEGITRGCDPPDNTLFCPEDPVTRAQMAAFMARMLDLPEGDAADVFIDDDGSVFEADIERVAAAGIAKGCDPPTDSMFCPDEPVTRQQMASFLARAFDLSAGAGLDWFEDDDGSVHERDVDMLRAAWITFGCNPPTENQFCPGDAVTRAQMAAFLRRASRQPGMGAAIGVHGSTWPDPLYYYDDIVGTFQVRNTGSDAVSDLEARVPEEENYLLGDCRPEMISGPVEVLGDGDDLLEPGELWDWYCAGRLPWDWDAMFLEVDGVSESGSVSSIGSVSYRPLHAVAATVSASAARVVAGEEVTWTIDLTNRANVECVAILVEARPESIGSYTQFWEPDEIIVGDNDASLDPGEVWRYHYSMDVWTDTWVEVTGSYAPAWSPGAYSGWGYVKTPIVEVIEPTVTP